MKPVISVKDLEEMVAQWPANRRDFPGDALLTPSARDFIRDYEHGGNNRLLNACEWPRDRLLQSAQF